MSAFAIHLTKTDLKDLSKQQTAIVSQYLNKAT